MFEFYARVLARDIFAVSAERHMLIEYIRADYNAAGVRACLSRHIFEFYRNVHDPSYFGVFVVHFDKVFYRIVHAVVLVGFFRVVFPEYFH